MKSVVYTGRRKIQIKNRKKPILKEGEALIKVSYVGICGTDSLVYNGGMNRVNPPVVLGHEFSGVIEDIKYKEATIFQIGDEVVAEPIISCQDCYHCKNGNYNVCSSFKLIGVDKDGAMAKYVKVPVEKLLKIAPTTTLKEASFVEPLAVGVHMVKKADVEKGDNVLVVGGGPIGLITAKVAKIAGAKVLLSEIDFYRRNKAEELGIDTINPVEENLKERIDKLKGDKYGVDISFEVTGTDAGINDAINSTKSTGKLVIAGLPSKKPEVDMYRVVTKELNIMGSRVYTGDDFKVALKLIEEKTFDPTPLISKEIELDNIVKEGFNSIEEGENVIKILINLTNEEDK